MIICLFDTQTLHLVFFQINSECLEKNGKSYSEPTNKTSIFNFFKLDKYHFNAPLFSTFGTIIDFLNLKRPAFK